MAVAEMKNHLVDAMVVIEKEELVAVRNRKLLILVHAVTAAHSEMDIMKDIIKAFKMDAEQEKPAQLAAMVAEMAVEIPVEILAEIVAEILVEILVEIQYRHLVLLMQDADAAERAVHSQIGAIASKGSCFKQYRNQKRRSAIQSSVFCCTQRIVNCTKK
ncbi:MAG: hypothetical protein RR590_01025 [Hungatella sp.]